MFGEMTIRVLILIPLSFEERSGDLFVRNRLSTGQYSSINGTARSMISSLKDFADMTTVDLEFDSEMYSEKLSQFVSWSSQGEIEHVLSSGHSETEAKNSAKKLISRYVTPTSSA